MVVDCRLVTAMGASVCLSVCVHERSSGVVVAPAHSCWFVVVVVVVAVSRC